MTSRTCFVRHKETKLRDAVIKKILQYTSLTGWSKTMANDLMYSILKFI